MLTIAFSGHRPNNKNMGGYDWHSPQYVADKVVLVDTLDKYKIKGYQEDIYYPAKMPKRNEFMCDKADILITVWDGSKGGTANCIRYMKKLGKEIIRIDPSNLSEVSIC